MSRILLQTTICAHPQDWDISRFSMLADELRAAGHEVVARNRVDGGDDPVLSHLDQLGYDQLWLMAVDVGNGLTAADAAAITRFRSARGGVLTARVSADGVPNATVLAQGRSATTGRVFNLAVLLDGERAPDGSPMGRAVAQSTFHHFADYNWDIGCGAPSFVAEPPGSQIKADPSRLEAFKDYVRNVAEWLHPAARLAVAV
ncbi:hypothetical protein AU190_07945 [Mycolicibacterium acapulense]|nr:hypothetical protein AU190_07945 [Mycolicibacterium acapulense]